MIFSLVLATLLCFTTWMSSVHTINGPAANCCIAWSNTKVHLQKIKNYTVQPDSPCPITAIVFYTKSKRICSNPDSNWAKKAMKKVDNDRKALLEMRKNQEGSASGIITPTIASSTKNTAQKKGRNGKRKGQRKRTGRRMQRKHA